MEKLTLFDHIENLHRDGLYANLVETLSLILPQVQHLQSLLAQNAEYQVHIYYGNALYYTKDYRKAEQIYRKALQLRKTLVKNNKRKSQTNLLNELESEADVKYQLSLCYQKLQQPHNAILVLEEIPAKQRNTRINAALGELYKSSKQVTQAVASFKEVLKDSPCAVKVILNMIQMDVKVNDILSIVSPAIANIPGLDWFPNWIKAQGCLYSSQVSQAITQLKQLHFQSYFKNNVDLLISLGKAFYFNGEYRKAIQIFKRAFALDPLRVNGLDVYSACLAKESQMKDLENLANDMVQRCDAGEPLPEPWIVLAYYCFLGNKKESKAVYFAQKACLLSNNSVEALLLKGTVLSEARSHSESLGYFHEAFTNAPYRFEAMKCLAEAYLSEKRKSSAMGIANHSIKTLGQNPRTLTLYASVLLNDPTVQEKKSARSALEKTVKLDATYLPAICLLSNLYMEEKNIDKTIDMLNKAIEAGESNTKLHRMLSDCYGEKGDQEKSLVHRNIASKLGTQLGYRNSSEASQRLEEQSHADDNVDSTLDLDNDDVPPSDEEIDESETEVVWSDDNYGGT